MTQSAAHDTPPAAPLVIAHRATMGHAPENTMAGIRQALSMSCDGVEIDVRLCADGVPVLIHDDLLDRTTNARGRVADATLAQLQVVDAGGGQPVPTLRAVIDEIDGQILLVIELKSSEGDDIAALCQAVLREIARADALPWTWLWSFDPTIVAELAQTAPTGRRIAHLCPEPTPEIWRAVSDLGLDGISVHHRALDASAAAACRAHRLALFTWTANEPDDLAHVAQLDPTGIVGDYPERIRMALGSGTG